MADGQDGTIGRTKRSPPDVFMVTAFHGFFVWGQLLFYTAGIGANVGAVLPVCIIFHGASAKIAELIHVLFQEEAYSHAGERH